MTGFFRNNHPASFILLPLLAVILWAITFIKPASSANLEEISLFTPLSKLAQLPVFSNLIAILLIIAGAFLLNYIVNEYEVLAKRSFMPALMYVIFMSISPDTQCLHPIQISNILLMFTLNALLDSYRKDTAFANVFNAGFFVSLAMMVYLPNIFYLPLLWLSIAIIRPFIWREWLIALFGILVPMIFLFSYYFFVDQLPEFIYGIKTRLSFSFHNFLINNYFHIVSKSAGVLLFFISLLTVFNNFSGNTQKAKRAIYILLFSILSGISIYLFLNEHAEIIMLSLSLPISVFTAYYFISAKKRIWADWWFIVLIGSIIFQQVNYLL